MKHFRDHMKRLQTPFRAVCFGLLIAFNVSATVHYVDVNGANPVAPYTSWGNAATNIQDAINVSSLSDTVLVTNGTYQSGGAAFNGSNRVYVPFGLGLKIQSVNGPQVTSIKGYQMPGATNGAGAIRCVYLTEFSTLSGFTLTGGATPISGNGGGVVGETFCVVSNCIISGNAASANGGGSDTVNGSALVNCVISGNVAGTSGGGAHGNSLTNCIVMNNSATSGGGLANGTAINCLFTGNGNSNSVTGTTGGAAYFSSLVNCTVVGNFAKLLGAVDGGKCVNSIIYYNYNGIYADCYMSQLTNCCTTLGTGNSTLPNNSISNAPAFVDLANGNYRLQNGSPGMDSGTNLYALTGTDLDGNARIVNGTVDMGAYEIQSTNLIHYVSLSCKNPVTPFTNWLTAATNLQDAIGVAQPGEIVAAGAGIYTNGGVVMFGAETNRVAVTNGITLLAVYGRQATLLVGGTQMRCAYVGSNSLISGFTITNGHTKTTGSPNLTNEESGGGIWCEPGGMAANCLVISNYANIAGTYSGGYGGGIYGGTISNSTVMNNVAGSGGGAGGAAMLWNCTLANNLAGGGGGSSLSALYNCTLSNNAAMYSGFSGSGGGASQCLASNCLLTGNSDYNISHGGGAYQGTNINCTLTGNFAGSGGGMFQSTNYNCVFYRNTASAFGGGAYQGTLYNCLLTGNLATNSSLYDGAGAGAYSSTLVNCTVTGNAATGIGGGISGGTAFNSIIYFNTAASGGENWTNSPQLYYCCTTPKLVSSPSSITNDPSFVDTAGGNYQLKCGSACIDAGFTNNLVQATTNDLRGVSRPLDGGSGLAKYDMGAYEYNPATDNVPAIRAIFSFSTFSTGFSVPWVAQIAGCADYFWWDFGDGTTITNQYSVSHAWAAPGAFNIRLSASYSGQVLSAMTTVQVVQQQVYYVDVANGSPVAPYTNWAKAANSIQSAIAAGNLPGRLVLVTNGVYSSSGVAVNGSVLNSVALTNPVILQSVNGAPVTFIQNSAGRCCYLGSNALLDGFTLTGGHALSTGDTNNDQSGGGVWCEPGGVVSNCVVVGCRATYFGGGAYQGTFYNCLFTNNSIFTSGSVARGGAVYQAVLFNCNLISNKVSSSFPGGKGGGSFGGTLSNCMFIGNSVNNGDSTGTGGGACVGTLYNCVLNGNSGNGYGGGSCSNTLWNCVVSGNWANYGGGAFASTFYNCLVTSNTAATQGGGSYSGTFYNCTVAGNAAPAGGGIYSALGAFNSIIYNNTNSTGSVDNSAGNTPGGSNNCIYPQFMPAAKGNITNDPAFVNLSAGDFHLQPNSRCINSGTNAYANGAVDLDFNPRICGGSVDMGAFELQSYVTGTFAAYLQQYGLPTDGSVDSADTDGDNLNNWQEWITGTIPTDIGSVLQLAPPLFANNPAGVIVSWQSVANVPYFLQRSSDLSSGFSLLQNNLVGQAGFTSYTDVTATNAGPYFYRVGVQ